MQDLDAGEDVRGDLAFEAIASVPFEGNGACSDCATDNLPLAQDPDPSLYPDAYCLTCVEKRIRLLRAAMIGGAK